MTLSFIGDFIYCLSSCRKTTNGQLILWIMTSGLTRGLQWLIDKLSGAYQIIRSGSFHFRLQWGWQVMEAFSKHYNDIIMSSMASQITSPTIVYSTIYSRAYQRKHQSSASQAFVWGIHRWPVNSPHIGPVARKMFTFDNVIMHRWLLVKSIHW